MGIANAETVLCPICRFKGKRSVYPAEPRTLAYGGIGLVI